MLYPGSLGGSVCGKCAMVRLVPGVGPLLLLLLLCAPHLATGAGAATVLSQSVRDALQTLEIVHLADALADEEITTVADVCALSKDDMRGMGMKIGARNRLAAWIVEQQGEATNDDETLPVVTEGAGNQKQRGKQGAGEPAATQKAKPMAIPMATPKAASKKQSSSAAAAAAATGKKELTAAAGKKELTAAAAVGKKAHQGKSSRSGPGTEGTKGTRGAKVAKDTGKGTRGTTDSEAILNEAGAFSVRVAHHPVSAAITLLHGALPEPPGRARCR